MSTKSAIPVPARPLVTTAEAARILGISRSGLWERIRRGEMPVVHTAPRKRLIPARVLPAPDCTEGLGFEWTRGDLTRRELAEALGVSYGTVSRAVAARFIPILDGRIPGAWIASHCDPVAWERWEAVVGDF